MNVQIVDFESPTAASELASSIHNTGFAVIKNHPFDFALINAIYEEWEGFFKSDYKHNYLYNKETTEGYLPMGTEKAKDSEISDIKEFYNLYTWGKFPDELSDQAKTLHTKMTTLSATLLTWIQDNTPEEVKTKFSMPLNQMINETRRNLMRVIFYPALDGSEQATAIRAGDHEDINLITILPAATHSGLQVKDRAGNWYDVPADPGTLIINAGDMLQLCSNGYYKSTTHRVINPEGAEKTQARMSMPMFIHPEDKVMLSDSINAIDYLFERLRENGLI